MRIKLSEGKGLREMCRSFQDMIGPNRWPEKREEEGIRGGVG